jgi:hypothetical protein
LSICMAFCAVGGSEGLGWGKEAMRMELGGERRDRGRL